MIPRPTPPIVSSGTAKYFLQDKLTRLFLKEDGNFTSRSLFGDGVKKFDTQEAAEAAAPEGKPCYTHRVAEAKEQAEPEEAKS